MVGSLFPNLPEIPASLTPVQHGAVQSLGVESCAGESVATDDQGNIRDAGFGSGLFTKGDPASDEGIASDSERVIS